MITSVRTAIRGIGVMGVAFGLITPVTVFLLEKNGTHALITGLVTTISYLSITVFSSFTGRLIEIHNLRRILKTGFALLFVCSLLSLFWINLWVLLPVRFLIGIGMTFVFVATEILINLSSAESERGRNFGIYVVSLSVGIAIGTLLIWTVRLNENLPFFSAAFLIAAGYFITLPGIKDHPALSENPSGIKLRITSLPAIGILSAVFYGLFESAAFVVISLYGLRSGFNQEQVSLFLTSYVAGGIVLFYLVSMISVRFSKYDLLLALSVILAIGFSLPLLLKSFLPLLVIFFLIGGIIPAFYTLGLAFTVSFVENKFIAQANGHFAMFYGIGTLIGPLIGAFFIEYYIDYGFWIFAVLLCVMYFLIFKSGRAQ